ncbi:MAG: bifunctional phosphoribosylaminoimidazolecarboxamide formyltransferase/IMP cyclohydrolase [Candidatus Diapherotrites archaeon]|nr:bifunctional phosphoribosylaminoimidazolecarboxamide formyltransferase/IMP cyclohydrolase [Candidatus Diapherotrites archaeon]
MLALISVSDKTGIVEFAKGLKELGYDIISTGGTAKVLRESGIDVIDVSEYTGFPEMMDGRVKTLHPKIHAGILGLRNKEEHMRQMEEHGIKPIDLVVVNLYPFEQTVSKGCSLEEAIENIDIGGPTLLRSAAKNFESVVVICNPKRYNEILEKLRKGSVDLETRKMLAAEVFMHTAHYDTIIGNYLKEEKFPTTLNLTYEKVQNLRYGENPHQEAAFYKEPFVTDSCLATAEQLHGKELSFNNILDMDSALKLVKEFDEIACVIVKHNNPCGAAIADKQIDAYRKALETDPISAFGGIIAFNTPVEEETAQEIIKRFYECVIAPGYSEKALEVLKTKKKLRLMKVPPFRGKKDNKSLEIKRVVGGILIQDRDQELYKELKVVTNRKPTDEEMKAMIFALKVCKHVKSNCVVYAKQDRTIGIGAGQMSRVDSSVIGAMKAKNAGLDTKGTALASDAFFPFRDAVDAAAEAGVTAIIQPGGSIRDQEVIDACNEHNIAMVFSGMRHFNH